MGPTEVDLSTGISAILTVHILMSGTNLHSRQLCWRMFSSHGHTKRIARFRINTRCSGKFEFQLNNNFLSMGMAPIVFVLYNCNLSYG